VLSPKEVHKTLDQLHSLIDASRRPQMDLMMTPHVAIQLGELAEYQTTLIADLGVRLPQGAGAGEAQAGPEVIFAGAETVPVTTPNHDY